MELMHSSGSLPGNVVAAMEEVKDLSQLSLHALMSSLEAHETRVSRFLRGSQLNKLFSQSRTSRTKSWKVGKVY